ncbi:MAG TPA: exo-beta-N-acetylmuramidase NamZ domain-containing protein, partial [Verrucomicrobiae bacterium]
PLNEFAAAEIYKPLKMSETTYLPAQKFLSRIAPTDNTAGKMLRGIVHDPTARMMGGVAGHAGLFTTIADLARFARMMLNEGELDGVRIFKPETIKLMTTVHSPEVVGARRGLGWDIDSGYSRLRGKLFPIGSYGHTGFTGTAIWIDPFSKSFWIFLSNRVHPDGKGNILPLQATLGTIAAEAIDDFDFANVPGALPVQVASTVSAAPARPSNRKPAEVLNGIDVLIKQNFAPLKKLRLGLITNHTGIDRHRRPTIDLLKSAPEVELKALFSPEHGIRGEADEKVSDSVDQKTGLPIYSLYGARFSPSPDQLKDLDALVYDIQDVGCRFYTYISTMGNCLQAAARAHVKFFVLDRANPIDGLTVEGPMHTGNSSFIAWHSLPLRTGMTMGELAKMFNAELRLNADLIVIPVQGWTRDMWFDETGLPWLNLSPNMRSLHAATLYPGLGLHETALSVGRGTDTPFELVGAPYIDDLLFASELNKANLSGLHFVPIRFTPTYSTFKGQSCGGASVVITDRVHAPVVDAGVLIAQTLHRLYPNDFDMKKFNRLLLSSGTVEAITAGKSLAEIKPAWTPGLDEFAKRRARYLIYK